MQRTQQDVKELQHARYDVSQKLAEINARLLVLQGKMGIKEDSFNDSQESVASRTGNKVHVAACFFAKSIKKKRTFSSKAAALNEGYKSCNCIV